MVLVFVFFFFLDGSNPSFVLVSFIVFCFFSHVLGHFVFFMFFKT